MFNYCEKHRSLYIGYCEACAKDRNKSIDGFVLGAILIILLYNILSKT